ncbi:hypothetical protein K450DRAFT_263840 [Umbelopsis ramanniana AG]|uniref:Uncharacterized protein n=1 Tax=Umbelopsis ramanniana AG TaxID=1314678 RepID=A0AAD5E1V7_UMBRA|nr:uncharacterized protein K450DRAFT_263840 [Umbelopsis ramanniana AG]KAI8574985.1 hypothetical protein K450DRAFT_263840 [Umbelopsis ramanniana AG]
MLNSNVAHDGKDRKYPCPLYSLGTDIRNSLRRHITRMHSNVDIGPGAKGHRTDSDSKIILKHLLLRKKLHYSMLYC